MRRWPVLSSLVATALVFTGCGGASRERVDAEAKNSVDVTTTRPTARGESSAGRGDADVDASEPGDGGGGEPNTPATSPSQGDDASASPEPPSPFDASLSPDCLHPADTVSLSISKARPDEVVLYTSKYSDGSSVLSKGYDTGDGHGRTDSEGSYETSWIVPPTAPPGRAKLTVAVHNNDTGDLEPVELMFIVKRHGEDC